MKRGFRKLFPTHFLISPVGILSDGNEIFEEFQTNSKVIWILRKNFLLKEVKYYTISSATSP